MEPLFDKLARHKTSLHWAAANGHRDIVELLLANKAEVNVKDQSGETPLFAAAGAGYTNVAELLREHGGSE
jgi:ankyrin repeat protein